MSKERTPMDDSPPRPKAIRRFTLLDGMILVAATACGLAVDRAIQSSLNLKDSDLFGTIAGLLGNRNFRGLGVLVVAFSVPVVAGLNLALIPLGLLKPRPRVRRLACRPGWMAACAVALALVFESVVLLMMVMSEVFGPDPLPELLFLIPVLVVPAILGAWLTLALGRCWCPEPSWLDRLGRALALCWFVLSIVGMTVIVIDFL
jgi:hypothetical protein